MVKSMGTKRIRVHSVAYPNKRRQMVYAIPDVATEITIFADDDVFWPPKLLPWILAPLEDEAYGAVGTNQRLRRAECLSFSQRIYGYLNALYLERRNFDCAACMYMDGGLPCLSGRTVAYRSSVIKDPAFKHAFTHEEWLGRYQLNADDDNFMTRWLVTHNKKIGYQYHKEAEVLTTLEDNPYFIKQCLRWSRSNWRSNITSMFWDRQIWRLVFLVLRAHTPKESVESSLLTFGTDASPGAPTRSTRRLFYNGHLSGIARSCISSSRLPKNGTAKNKSSDSFCFLAGCS